MTQSEEISVDVRPVLSVCIYQIDGELGYTVHNMEAEEPEDVTDQFELANVETADDHRGGFALLRKP